MWSRLLSGAFTGIALIFAGSILGALAQAQPIATWMWPAMTVAIFAAAAAAFAEIFIGVTGARAEERRARARILGEVFSSTSLPKNAEERFSSAALLQLMSDNAERMAEFRQQYWGSTLAALSIPVMAVAYITFGIDLKIGLLIAIMIPIVPLIIGGFLKALRRVSAKSRGERTRLTAQYLDAIRNLVTIRLSGAGERLEKRLRAQGEQNRGAIMKLLAGNQLVIIVLDGVFSLFLICWSVFLVQGGLTAGTITIGEAITTIFLLVLLLEPLTQVAGFFYVGMGGIASMRAIRAYLQHVQDQREETAKLIESHKLTHPTTLGDAEATGTAAVTPGGAIRAKGVNYDYGRGPVLHGVSFNVAEGERAAIVGRSGAGKSTLLSLLRGSLQLQTGSLQISGHDLAALTPAEIRSLAATVSQSTWLFTGTIADNLRIANPDASTEQMWDALTKAQLADEIRAMPLGLDSPVGERGSLISGGQAQRLSLARALLSNRKVLFLDEPTSQVDHESEARIIKALAELGRDLTIVMVTHREALLDLADSTYEMNEGHLNLRDARSENRLVHAQN